MAVRDAAFVRGVQAEADLVHQREPRVERARRDAAAALERRAFEQFHRHVRTPVMLAKIENGHDVGMRHLSGHSRLLMHPEISRKSDPHGDPTADVLLSPA